MLGVAAVVVALDQLIKALVVATLEQRDPIVIIDGLIQLRVLRNFGAAFSVGSSLTWIFTGIAVIVAIVVVRTARSLTSDWWAVALGALLGGALGNLVDRLTRSPGGGQGGVVDYIDVPWFSVFNLADISLTFAAIGIAVLAVLGVPMTAKDLSDENQDPTRPEPAPDDGDILPS